MARKKAKEKIGTGQVASLPATQPAALAQMIDQALQLLAERIPKPLTPSLGPIAPLPSLLARCEALLQVPADMRVPLRLIHCFCGDGADAVSTLLARIPNLREIGVKAAQDAGNCDAVSMAVRIEAQRAFLIAQTDGFAGRGLTAVTRLEHLQHYQNTRATGISVAFDATADRVVRACVVAEHPLLSYMKALRRGQLAFRPASLEAFCDRYLAFLQDHHDLPVITPNAESDDPAGALRQLGAVLDLALPHGLIDEVRNQPSGLAPAEADMPMQRYGDGSPATDEPLDTQAYLRLCNRLGFAPDTLPEPAPEAVARAAAVLKRPLPARPNGRGPSRITDFVPLIARITDGADARSGNCDASSIVGMIEDCLDHPDGFYEALDTYLGRLPGRDAALLLMGCAAHFAAIGEAVHAFALLAEAEDHIDLENRPLRLLAVELLLRLRKPEMALIALTADALVGRYAVEPAQRTTLKAALEKFAPNKSVEHGHSLLMAWLEANPTVALGKPRVMIEIGTTRERVSGQGSTEKLAVLCARLGIDFITVDMDPRNSDVARKLFRKLSLPFRAVTSKGEDFLAAWGGPIDYCFLDAYDFDHGKHSDLRQSRYETFLGSRIADEQCHQMHLDCAVSLVKKLSPDGVICFDDTWTDPDMAWTAKGKTAMPYLLAHDFRVIEARDRAALLVRR